ncbi:MAG TPA: tRNA (adenosine(37)-N6)-threonylcarbamoyltransferase complex ATPase subunit type 1 TsaE [Candidatus Acidoferrum sp.]|nr:tRNA (adenosine(37)-N6)-threonylcarbamoyltransferase complex ATPase subunit type 1 TsaE [Candidatus Acidoferrum sp.]
MAEEVITHSAEETTSWGRQFAERLKAPIVVLLSGDLGSGKTTLTKGIVSGLGAASEEEVTSPTFTLVHVYGDSQRSAGKVHHVDLYRIENFHDFETLGMEDVFEKPGVLIVEWAERFPLKSPWPQVRMRLEHLEGDTRRLTVLPQDDAYL